VSVDGNQRLPRELEAATSKDLAGLNRRDKLQELPVSALNELMEEGRTKPLNEVESALQEEAEEIITEEIGLEDYLPPSKFLVPKPEPGSTADSILQSQHGTGRESGIYRSDVNSVVISTDFGEFNGTVDTNLLSTAFHELIHNDTYNRLTEADETLHSDRINGLNTQIEDINLLEIYRFELSDMAADMLDGIEPKESVIDEVSSQYKITKFELTQLSEDARDKIASLSEKYNSSGRNREDIVDEAYEIVQNDIDVYHLNSIETQPEKEAFAWLGSMYLTGDLEGKREQQAIGFPSYDREDEIEHELEALTGVYDNLVEHGNMESEEAMNYILEEVQPRKFGHKASKIREDLEN
jgi:hypothetical protein